MGLDTQYPKGGPSRVRLLLMAIGAMAIAIMGLAGYGNIQKDLYEGLRRFMEISKDGLSVKCKLRRDSKSEYRMNKFKMDAYHRYKVIHSPNPPLALKKLTRHYSAPDIAATGQKVFEDLAMEMIQNLLK